MYITKEAKKHLMALDKLPTNTQMMKYCKANLTKIGSGSSRDVYALSDTLVVKVAKGGTGIKQNENEIRIWNLVDYSFPYYKRSFAAVAIKECHWKDFYIVMERLDKGVSSSLFNTKAIRAWRTGKHETMHSTSKRIFKHVQDTDDNAFTNNIADISVRNMGVSRNGVVKMLDYGFSTPIWYGLAKGKIKNRETLFV